MNYTLACAYEEMNPSRRNTMEDVHRVIPCLGGDPNFSYFGVYDGHGGRQIADFLEEALENTIYQELQIGDDATIPERLARAFLITDCESKKSGIMTSGATCVSALLHNDGGCKKLYVANVGDSRAVLCAVRNESGNRPENECGYCSKRLSYDHTADDPNEQARIKAAGGFITRGRVLGILAVARSFGDHGMKDFVTAEPHLSEVELSDGGVGSFPFLILACDGVWDVMSDQEAIEMVLRHTNNGKSSNIDAAQLLVDEAIERGTSDNVTAIVVFF